MKSYKQIEEELAEVANNKNEDLTKTNIAGNAIKSIKLAGGKEFFLAIIESKDIGGRTQEFAYVTKNKKEYTDAFTNGGPGIPILGIITKGIKPLDGKDFSNTTFVKFVK